MAAPPLAPDSILPLDVWKLVCGQASIQALGRLSQCSKLWRTNAELDDVWKIHYTRDFSNSKQSPLQVSEELRWKDKYRVKLLATLVIKWKVDSPMHQDLPKWKNEKVPLKMSGGYGVPPPMEVPWDDEYNSCCVIDFKFTKEVARDPESMAKAERLLSFIAKAACCWPNLRDIDQWQTYETRSNQLPPAAGLKVQRSADGLKLARFFNAKTKHTLDGRAPVGALEYLISKPKSMLSWARMLYLCLYGLLQRHTKIVRKVQKKLLAGESVGQLKHIVGGVDDNPLTKTFRVPWKSICGHLCWDVLSILGAKKKDCPWVVMDVFELWPEYSTFCSLFEGVKSFQIRAWDGSCGELEFAPFYPVDQLRPHNSYGAITKPEFFEWWKSFPQVPGTEDEDTDEEVPARLPAGRPKNPPAAENARTEIPDPPEALLAAITSLGFSRATAVISLHAMNNNVERAIDWILTNDLQ